METQNINQPSVPIVVKKFNKIKYIIILLLLLIVLFYAVKLIARDFNFRSSVISGTQGIDSLVSVSPSGKYLLFLKYGENGNRDSEGYITWYPTHIAIKDIITGEIREIENPDRFGYQKNGWTQDEKYFSNSIKTIETDPTCFQNIPEWAITEASLKSFKDNCSNSYFILDPVFTYKEGGFETILKEEYNNKAQSFCSDCAPSDIVNATLNKIKEFLGGEEEPGALDLSGYSIGKSGKAYYTKVESGKEDSLYVFDPIKMKEDKLFSKKSFRDTCFNRASISPDETKVIFVINHGCGFNDSESIYVFDLLKKKDINLGKKDIKGNPIWSPDSKSFYFVRDDRVLERINIK